MEVEEENIKKSKETVWIKDINGTTHVHERVVRRETAMNNNCFLLEHEDGRKFEYNWDHIIRWSWEKQEEE